MKKEKEDVADAKCPEEPTQPRVDEFIEIVKKLRAELPEMAVDKVYDLARTFMKKQQ